LLAIQHQPILFINERDPLLLETSDLTLAVLNQLKVFDLLHLQLLYLSLFLSYQRLGLLSVRVGLGTGLVEITSQDDIFSLQGLYGFLVFGLQSGQLCLKLARVVSSFI